MIDPVILGSTGVSYERGAIEAWLLDNPGINPEDYTVLDDTRLFPNVALVGVIRDFMNWAANNRDQVIPENDPGSDAGDESESEPEADGAAGGDNEADSDAMMIDANDDPADSDYNADLSDASDH